MSTDRIQQLLAENQRLQSALMAIVETPRKAGILACHRIAAQALRGAAQAIEPREASLGDPVYFTRVIQYLHERWHRQCAYCQGKDELQIDHLRPVSRGGSDDIWNLCLACKACNQRKGTQTADEFGFRDVALMAAGSTLPTFAQLRARQQANARTALALSEIGHTLDD